MRQDDIVPSNEKARIRRLEQPNSLNCRQKYLIEHRLQKKIKNISAINKVIRGESNIKTQNEI